MIPSLLVLLPIASGAALAAPPLRPAAPWLLLAAAAATAAAAWTFAATAATGVTQDGLFLVDPTSRLFVATLDALFLGVAAHVAARRADTTQPVAARFAPLSLVFLGLTNLALLTTSPLMAWCALEMSTLAAAPLVASDGTERSFRASWQYFLFSSVGLATALIGLVCLQHALGPHHSLTYTNLDHAGDALLGPWAALGVALLVAGYGTKLGLSPMNTWLPPTYEAAPSEVTALLGAVQFNAALVGLLRVVEAFHGHAPEVLTTTLLVMGMLSMAWSTVGIIATRDFVRLLGYASINHAGVIAVGLALGGVASYGVLLYVLSNALIKAILFLSAGRIRARFGTSDAGSVRGLIKVMPYSGGFLMVGTFALLGLPPFGSFQGELLILSAILESGYGALMLPFCALLATSFVATAATLFPMIWGESPTADRRREPERLIDVGPKLAFLAVLVVLGVYVPAPVNELLRELAVTLGGR